MGDTVNLASRMEGLAEHGTTYVTEETFNLTKVFFQFEALGKKKVKGKKDSIKAYRVVTSTNRRTRFDVSSERGLTPFIGRERELELLCDSFERAKAGRGQAVSIIADAGVGKSRLLYEFKKSVANEDVTFVRGGCLSYSKGVPYHLHVDILKTNFDIRDGDRDSEIREKVIKGLEILETNKDSITPYLLYLLGVKDSGIDITPLSPEVKKDRILEALKQIVLKGSERLPLILAYEDLHWMDKNSEDVLKYILESIPGARVLLIFIYRPAFEHTWDTRSYHSQLNLNRLSNRESLTMLADILGTQEIAFDLEDLVLGKTEGLPFFIEEFVRSLQELEIVERKDKKYYLTQNIKDLTIPSTIQDVIMARVDSLPDEAKEVLQAGSVIEREFSYDLIRHIAGLPEKPLVANLAILKNSELLYERGIYPNSTYVFKHALTREVVYDSILTKKRKELHDNIGNTIEKFYKNRMDEYYGALSKHFILSENYEKGAEYARFAGKQAQEISAYSDAINYAKKGVYCLEQLSQTIAVQRRIIDARTALSNYCMGLNYHNEGMQAVAPIVNLANEINYRKRLPRIYVATGTYKLFVEEDLEKGIEDLSKAKTLSEETGDFFTLWLACNFLGSAYWQMCDYEKSSTYFQMNIDMSEAANNVTGICFAKSTMAACNYAFSGKIDKAYKTSKESFDLVNESNDLFAQEIAYTSFGSCCLFKGLFKESENYLLEAIRLDKKTNSVVWGGWSHFWLGELYFYTGNFKKSQHYCNQANLIIEHRKILSSWCNYIKIKSIRAQVMQNRKGIQLESIFEYAKQSKIRLFQGQIANNICSILINIDIKFLLDAEEWINKAIKANKQNCNKWELAGDYALYADLLQRKGDHLDANEKLRKAIEIYQECGANGWMEKCKKELATIS